MPHHAGLPRAFDLSARGYFLDFALVPIVAGLLTGFAWQRGLSLVSLGLCMAAGMLAWSLAEYWIHRLLFHGRTPFEPMHQMHHALPKDMIGVATWGTFVGFAAIWLAMAALAGALAASVATAGFMLGYLFYCTIHVSIHHADAIGFGRYGRLMMRLHHAHHRGGKGNFGVSSPIWDFVFRTYRST